MKFPVVHSVLSASSLQAHLMSAYSLGEQTEVKLFRAAMNHLYVVTDEENQFVFRVYTANWRTKQEIEEELRLLIYLNQNKASVSFPIPNRANCHIEEFEAPEGKRYGVLFSFADGIKTARFSPEASFSIGKSLALIHTISENYKLDRQEYTSSILLDEGLKGIRSFFLKDSEELQFLDSLSNSLKLIVDNLNLQDVRKGAVHLDVWFDNLHLNKDNKVTFFDFDFCGNGILAMDISYFLYQLFSTNLNPLDYEEKAKQFLAGYQSETKLNVAEIEALPYLSMAIMIYYLSIQCDRFDYWTNIFLNEDHLKRNVSNLKRWMDYHNMDLIRSSSQ